MHKIEIVLEKFFKEVWDVALDRYNNNLLSEIMDDYEGIEDYEADITEEYIENYKTAWDIFEEEFINNGEELQGCFYDKVEEAFYEEEYRIQKNYVEDELEFFKEVERNAKES